MYMKLPNRVIFTLILHNDRWASNFKMPTGNGHLLVPIDRQCRSLDIKL